MSCTRTGISRSRFFDCCAKRPDRVLALALSLLMVSLATAPRVAAAPGDVLWTFQGIEDINATAEIPDVDMDGIPEIAVETYDAGAGTADHLYLLSGGSSGTADVIWSIRPFGGVSSGGGDGDDCLNATPDLSGDDFPDLVLGTAWGGRSAYGINGRTGALLWTFDTYVDTPPVPPESGWVYTIHPIADLDDDLVSDVIFGCGSDNNGAYALSGATGAVIYRLNALDVIYTSSVLGDVDGDTLPEAVFGGGDNDDRVYCVRGSSTGTSNPLWIVDPGSSNWHLTGFTDVDGDTKNDVVIGVWSSTNQVRCLSGANGSQIWAYSTGSFNYVMRVVPLDDVDGDQVPDLAVASWDNATHVVSGTDGTRIWRMEAGTLNGGDVWAVDRIDDVTGDGISDVVAGSFDNKVYLYDGVSGAEIWSVNVGARLYTVRGVSDISGNGIPDVVAGTQMLSGAGGRLFAIEGNDAAGVEIPAVVSARPLPAGIEVAWETDRFLPGTTFNLYRRDLGQGEAGKTGAGGGMRALKATLAQADLPAREIKELAIALSEENPFRRLNAEPIQPEAGRVRYLDEATEPGTSYEYRVGWMEAGRGVERFLDPVSATVSGAPGIRLSLGLPTPQPAQGEVALDLELAAGVTAEVTVYGIDGRPVRRLAGPAAGEGTSHRLRWDGRDEEGRPLPAGIYLVTASAGSLKASQKVVLVP